MDCPVCSVPLIVVERHGIELDYCHLCKGIWFDEGELKLLSQALGIGLDLPDIRDLPATEIEEKKRSCTRCSKKMDKVVLARVVVDRCPRGHGLWFDWGELGQVMERTATPENKGGEQVMRFLGETIRLKRGAG